MGEAAKSLSGTGASAASVGALGLSAYGSYEKGAGTQAADEFQAEKAERAADFGRMQAGLTDQFYNERLKNTLANIDVIRGAANTDPHSPTGTAVDAWNTILNERQRSIAQLNIQNQVKEDESSAEYLHEAGRSAMLGGEIGAGISIASAVAKMALL